MKTVLAVRKWREVCAEVLGVSVTVMGRREVAAGGSSLLLVFSVKGFE